MASNELKSNMRNWNLVTDGQIMNGSIRSSPSKLSAASSKFFKPRSISVRFVVSITKGVRQ